MGIFGKFAEDFLYGATFGLSDKLGVTNSNGGDDRDEADGQDISVYMGEEGVYLTVPQFQLSWSDIAAVSQPQNGLLAFSLRGGLLIFTGSFCDTTNGAVDFSALCGYTARTADQLMAEDDKDLPAMIDDLRWTNQLANAIRGGDENLFIDEEGLFRLYSVMSFYLQMAESSGNVPASDEKKYREAIEYFTKCLEAQFSRIDENEEVVKANVEMGLFALSGITVRGVYEQKKRYEELSAARKYAETPALDKDAVISVLTGFNGEESLLGSDEWATERRTLVCTDKPLSLPSFSKRNRIPGTMIMDVADLVEYNAAVAPEYQLVFQPGHPQNGCTYVQHPFRKNVYYEVNSYHDSIRERKQNELLRILESLGAYSAKVEVRHEDQDSVEDGNDFNATIGTSYGVFSGSGGRKIGRERQNTVSSLQNASKHWTFNPPENPCLPGDLVFYPTEETWQQLAESVLRGGLKQAVVDLEYKSEYGVTEKYLSEISTAVKFLIPSFDMNLSRSFTSNLHRLTTTQWHYEVVFENEDGERAGRKTVDSGAGASSAAASPAAAPVAETAKVEALFLKRAKRYAQSEGHINAEQRADLEAFAQKYGIDEFRMEELIEEAF
ncbi:MAG: hypothetical protein J5985_00355 [Kiritimatiellae bacterium]|nr:hypothetical protein [Kiritimatiellia bacterium]